MLVVLDAGVFVSAAVTPGGVASRIVAAGIEGRFEYLLCPRLVTEFTQVLARPKISRFVSARRSERFISDVVGGGSEVADPIAVPRRGAIAAVLNRVFVDLLGPEVLRLR